LFNDFEHQEVEATEAKAIQFDLRKLHETQVATPGLRWRLNFLNKSLGSLRQGDFGFIFARPETGKTTFLASEISKMIQQTDGEVLWFNNEEQGNKVAIRCYQAVLGVTTEKLFSNLDMYQKQFEDLVQNRIKIYDFEDSSRASRIEAILKESNPALIIFDQIDKIKGFKGDRNDLELKAIYQWAREIAKTYAPVIGVSQAGGEAEGKLWLTMDMVDGSKTAKQGEADWILGIGKEQDNTSRTRYLNITKNKLLGDSDTLPELRHGSAQVLIKPEIARYEDL
jgi:replicative DNA helicase